MSDTTWRTSDKKWKNNMDKRVTTKCYSPHLLKANGRQIGSLQARPSLLKDPIARIDKTAGDMPQLCYVYPIDTGSLRPCKLSLSVSCSCI